MSGTLFQVSLRAAGLFGHYIPVVYETLLLFPAECTQCYAENFNARDPMKVHQCGLQLSYPKMGLFQGNQHVSPCSNCNKFRATSPLRWLLLTMMAPMTCSSLTHGRLVKSVCLSWRNRCETMVLFYKKDWSVFVSSQNLRYLIYVDHIPT